jgi:hypothetical protein
LSRSPISPNVIYGTPLSQLSPGIVYETPPSQFLQGIVHNSPQPIPRSQNTVNATPPRSRRLFRESSVNGEEFIDATPEKRKFSNNTNNENENKNVEPKPSRKRTKNNSKSPRSSKRTKKK